MVEGRASRDFVKVMEWALGDTAGFDALIERLVQAVSAHLIAQIEAGAEIVQLFDSWAGVVPPEAFDRLVIAPTRRIVDLVHGRHPDTPIIGFPRGVAALYERYFVETGVDALSIDAAVSPELAARTLQPHGAIQGNLDPRVLVTGGTALDEAVGKIIDALRDGPFVFNLGHGVLPETPPENVARLATLIRTA
jgi:uroporphyrinogen decarboxylase